VVASNTGGSTGTLDEIVDNLPAGVTYSAGTARINNRLVAPVVTGTVATGQTLRWFGPLSVPAGGQLRVTYDVAIPATPGTYVNSVIGRFGTQIIDASENLESDMPATATVIVRSSDSGDSTPTVVVPALSATTPAGQSVSVTSTDPAVTISALSTNPLNGAATITNGVLTYTPNAGFVGVDGFDYVGSDGTGSGINTITITVTSVDLIARPDVYTVATNTDLNANVCANDQFPQSVCQVSTLGVASPLPGLNSNGTFTFRSANSGVFDYNYVLQSSGASVSAAVKIYVTTRSAVFLKTNYFSSVDSAVLGNLQGDFDIAPRYGTSTLQGSGQNNSLRYLPDQNFWGIDSYTYKSTNDNGPVRVLVAPPPVAVAVQAGQPVSKSLTDRTFLASQVAPSPFIVDCPGCLFEVSTSAQHGVFSLNANTGAFSYLPEAGTAATSDTVVLKITDMASPADKNMFVFGTINFTISEFVEVVANDDALTVLANSDPVSFNVSDNDRCPGGCEVLTTSLPTGVAQTSTTGAFTFTPGETLGAQTFTYTLKSTSNPSVTDTAIVTVYVEGAVSDSATAAPGQQVTIAVLVNDPCTSCVVDSVTGVAVGTATHSDTEIRYTPPDWFAGATTFTYTVRAPDNGSTSSAVVTVNVIQAVNDSFTVSSNVATTLDPLANDLCVDCRITSTSTGTIVDEGFGLQVTAANTTSLTYEITDASGATSSATIALTVAEPPAAADDQVATFAGVAVAVDVLANDKRTASASDCASGCSAEILSDPANGSVSLRADGTLQYSPRGDFAGVDTFTYLVINDFGLTDTGTVTVEVNPVAVDDAFTIGTGLNGYFSR
jgi:hypothetical protein